MVVIPIKNERHNHNHYGIFIIEMREMLNILKVKVKMVVIPIKIERHNHNTNRKLVIDNERDVKY